jgi:hypothetical protein
MKIIDTVNLVFAPDCVLGRMLSFYKPIDTHRPTPLLNVGVIQPAMRTSTVTPTTRSPSPSSPTSTTPQVSRLLGRVHIDDHAKSPIDIERLSHPTSEGGSPPPDDIPLSITAQFGSRSELSTEIHATKYVYRGALWDIYSGTLTTTHSRNREARTIEVIIKISSPKLFYECWDEDREDSTVYSMPEAAAAIENEDRIYQGALHDLQGGAIPAYYGLYSSYTGPPDPDKPRGVRVMVLEKLEVALSEEELLSDLRDDLK